MRIAGVIYIILSLAANFIIGSTETLVLAFLSFPLTIWLLLTKRKNKSKDTKTFSRESETN